MTPDTKRALERLTAGEAFAWHQITDRSPQLLEMLDRMLICWRELSPAISTGLPGLIAMDNQAALAEALLRETTRAMLGGDA